MNRNIFKRVVRFLPDLVGVASLAIFVAGVGAVFSIAAFLKIFRVNPTVVVRGEKSQAVRNGTADYSGIYNIFSVSSSLPASSDLPRHDVVVSSDSGNVVGAVITGKDRFLLVSDGSNFKILKEGDSLNGKRIVKITRLFYQFDDGRRVYLFSGEISRLRPRNQRPVQNVAGKRVIRLDRTMVEKETADIGKLLKDVNVVPVLRRGETIGYRFLRIRPGTILTKIGFKNGDIVTAVNDIPVRTVEDAFRIYNMLRNEDTVKVEIERRGRKEVIIYEIR
ncbi:PDZ domain-containing protein [Desulfurobacterium sp.]